MRWAIAFLALLTVLWPCSAAAQASDTLRYVISRGVVLTVQGHTIPMVFNEDGTYSGEAADAAFKGTWRVEGESLCTASLMSQMETCVSYPPGKRPGERFDVISPTLGRVVVIIPE